MTGVDNLDGLGFLENTVQRDILEPWFKRAIKLHTDTDSDSVIYEIETEDVIITVMTSIFLQAIIRNTN